jgi:hypothetical protein
MDRTNTSILFSLLSGVALFLFIAYSAIKTIDSSSQPDNYYVVSQGVDFHEAILNAPSETSYAQYEQPDVSIPEYSPDNASYEASGTDNSGTGHESGYSNNSGGTGSTNKSGGSNESNSGVGALAFNSNKEESAAADAAGTTTSSLTTDGSLTSTTRQAAGGVNSHGGRDPGGKNPHSSIPVGDGLLFLLFLSGIYCLWKSATKIKQRLTTSYFNLFSIKNKNVRA